MTRRSRGPISFSGYLVLGALTMITPLATNIYVPALPDIARAFGSTAAAVEVTVSATLVGIAVGQLMIGSISDHLGRRIPALVGTLGFVIASILCAFSPNLTVLIVLRFVQGFAGASGVVLARASIRDRVGGAASAQALSRLLIVAAIAPVLAPFLGAIALHFTDWRGVLMVLAGMGAVAFLMSLRWFPETWHRRTRDTQQKLTDKAARSRLLRDRHFWAYVAVSGSIGMISFAWLSSSPFFLSSEYGMGATAYSIFLGSGSLVFLLSAWINSRSVMRIGPRAALIRGMLIITCGSTILVIAALTHAPFWVVAIGAYASFGAYGGMVANSQAMAMRAHGDAAGTASAFLGSSQFIFGAVIPPIVAHFFGVTWALGATMLLAALVGLILTIANPEQSAQDHDEVTPALP